MCTAMRVTCVSQEENGKSRAFMPSGATMPEEIVISAVDVAVLRRIGATIQQDGVFYRDAISGLKYP